MARTFSSGGKGLALGFRSHICDGGVDARKWQGPLAGRQGLPGGLRSPGPRASFVYFIFFEVNRNLSYTLRIGFYVRLIVMKMNLLSYGQGDAYGSLLFDKGTCEKLLSPRVGGYNH